MPINPSTDPAVYNTGSLKCIRAGSPEWEGRWFFFFFFLSSFAFSTSLVSNPRTLHSRQSPYTHTHTPSRHTLSRVLHPPCWSLYSLANTLRWNELLLWCVQEHFPPPLTISLLIPASLACHLFDFHPPLAVIFTPILLSIYPPLTLSLPSSSYSFSTSSPVSCSFPCPRL